MRRPILLTCAGVLLAACASGADVAENDTSTDSAVVETLDPSQVPPEPKDAQP